MFTIYTNIQATSSTADQLGNRQYDLCIDGFDASITEEARINTLLIVRLQGASTAQALREVKALPWVKSVAYNSLCDYRTGKELRPASTEEMEASVKAAETDGGYGIIEIDGTSCFVS